MPNNATNLTNIFDQITCFGTKRKVLLTSLLIYKAEVMEILTSLIVED